MKFKTISALVLAAGIGLAAYGKYKAPKNHSRWDIEMVDGHTSCVLKLAKPTKDKKYEFITFTDYACDGVLDKVLFDLSDEKMEYYRDPKNEQIVFAQAQRDYIRYFHQWINQLEQERTRKDNLALEALGRKAK